MTTASADRKGDARQRLLVRLLEAFDGDVPSPEMSLREVAARAETSHALLRYHFGSLPGVLAAMLVEQRARDNQSLVKVAQRGTFDDLVGAIWRAYTRPKQLARARGFFHVVGLAAYGPGDFPEFVDSLDDLTTMLASLAVREGRDTKDASSLAAVTVAAIRGLLLQQVLSPSAHSQDAVALILRMGNGGRAP